jgi:hypothetical protein
MIPLGLYGQKTSNVQQLGFIVVKTSCAKDKWLQPLTDLTASYEVANITTSNVEKDSGEKMDAKTVIIIIAVVIGAIILALIIWICKRRKNMHVAQRIAANIANDTGIQMQENVGFDHSHSKQPMMSKHSDH